MHSQSKIMQNAAFTLTDEIYEKIGNKSSERLYVLPHV